MIGTWLTWDEVNARRDMAANLAKWRALALDSQEALIKCQDALKTARTFFYTDSPSRAQTIVMFDRVDAAIEAIRNVMGEDDHPD